MHLVVAVADFIVIYLLFRNFLNFKLQYEDQYSRHIIAILIAASLAAIVNSFHNVWLDTVFSMVATYLFSGVLWTDSRPRRLLLTTSIIALETLAETVTLILTAEVLQIGLSEAAQADYLLFPLSITSRLLLLVVVRILTVCIPKRKFHEGNLKNNGILILVPFLGSITIYLIVSLYYGYSFDNRDIITLTLIGACLVLSSVISFYVYDSEATKQDLKFRLERTEMNSKIQELYYQRQELDEQRSRAVLHDIKGQLINIQKLLTNQNPAAADYVNELILSMKGEPLRTPSAIHNPVLEISIEKTQELCLAEGIRFTVQLEQVNLDLLSMLDTGIVLDNLLDNAVQACHKLESNQEKYIILTIRHADNNILICIKNTKQNLPVATQNGCLLSSKRGGNQFGQGFENVRQAVRQNGGVISYRDNGAEFEVSILLPRSSGADETFSGPNL